MTRHDVFLQIVTILAIVLILFLFATYSGRPAPAVYDIDQDGKVNSHDVDIVFRVFTKEFVATPSGLERCDLDQDGIVSDADVVQIFEYVLKGGAGK